MAIRTRTRKVGIRVRKRVNPLPPATHERGHKSVLLRRDVIDLEAEASNSALGKAKVRGGEALQLQAAWEWEV